MPKTNQKTVIGICGLGGAGKDTAIKEISKIRKISEIQLRTIVEDQLKLEGKEINNENLRICATKLREKYGQDVIAKRAVKKVKKMLLDTDFVIINSIKSLDEADTFRKGLKSKFILLSVYASPKTRFERLSKRGLAWDMTDYKSFEWRDRVELSWGLGGAIAMADFIILNEGTIAELNRDVISLIKRMEKQKRR
jgi:dephospho-CoA kinase